MLLGAGPNTNLVLAHNVFEVVTLMTYSNRCPDIASLQMDGRQYRISGMACEVLGAPGGSDVVLLHGWGCDRESLRAQLHYFSETSRVIAPDLPGFGESISIADPTVPNFAQGVLNLLSELESESASVIGHSMGGLVGLEMSQQAPQAVGCLAMLDAVLWPSSELKGAIAGISGTLQAGHFDEALAATKEALFSPDDNREIVQMFERSFAAAERDTLVASFISHLIDYNPEPAIAKLKCPVAYIATDSALTALEQLPRRIQGIRTGKVLGSGHFAPRLVPQQMNAMLAAFIAMT